MGYLLGISLLEWPECKKMLDDPTTVFDRLRSFKVETLRNNSVEQVERLLDNKQLKFD